ncbi:branched-chain amino acid aminotransferase [Striga asiatica]|uniref:Branched-chain amino acid aminotransferase n=1 Tax=Striga asiatica TaxID=4170 RepID=A0A5A7PFA4_STRAF|nr:branched-chain amino acid aminotransferase [Striga asiatica]
MARISSGLRSKATELTLPASTFPEIFPSAPSFGSTNIPSSLCPRLPSLSLSSEILLELFIIVANTSGRISSCGLGNVGLLAADGLWASVAETGRCFVEPITESAAQEKFGLQVLEIQRESDYVGIKMGAIRVRRSRTIVMVAAAEMEEKDGS